MEREMTASTVKMLIFGKLYTILATFHKSEIFQNKVFKKTEGRKKGGRELALPSTPFLTNDGPVLFLFCLFSWFIHLHSLILSAQTDISSEGNRIFPKYSRLI